MGVLLVALVYGRPEGGGIFKIGEEFLGNSELFFVRTPLNINVAIATARLCLGGFGHLGHAPSRKSRKARYVLNVNIHFAPDLFMP